MDIIAHGLWGGIVAKVANNKKINKKPISIRWFVFWSMTPDVFAFAALFFWLAGSLLAGTFSLSDLPHPSAMEPMGRDTIFIFRLTNFLYNMGHSLVIFFVVFGVVSYLRKKSSWAMAGWLLHILIDIPTHSYQFYPTPFLWPLSRLEVNGYSWSHLGFIIINYLAIICVYLYLYWYRRKRRIKQKLYVD